jgi:hypothetical protein
MPVLENLNEYARRATGFRRPGTSGGLLSNFGKKAK